MNKIIKMPIKMFKSYKSWILEEKTTLYSYPGYKYTYMCLTFLVANAGYGGRSWFIKINDIDVNDDKQFYTKKDAIEECKRLIDNYLKINDI